MNPEDFELASGTDGDDAESSLDALVEELTDDAGGEEAAAETASDAAESGFEWVDDVLADADSHSLRDVRDVNHVLVCAPLCQAASNELCVDLATTAATGSPSVLSLSLTRSSHDLLELWERYAAVDPANLALVRVGAQSRPPSAVSIGPATDAPTELTVTSVADPSDLPRLGVKTTELLSDWRDQGHRPVVCVHSITTLLQYVERARLFRFLHLLKSRIDSVDGVGHYHVDPGSHSAETLRIFESLFDAVVDVTEDGDVTVDVTD